MPAMKADQSPHTAALGNPGVYDNRQGLYAVYASAKSFIEPILVAIGRQTERQRAAFRALADTAKE